MKIYTFNIKPEKSFSLEKLEQSLKNLQFDKVTIQNQKLLLTTNFKNKFKFNFRRDLINQGDRFEISYDPQKNQVAVILFAGLKFYFFVCVIAMVIFYSTFVFKIEGFQLYFFLGMTLFSIFGYFITLFAMNIAFKKVINFQVNL